jgi:aspartate aminotransferase-like enzyme
MTPGPTEIHPEILREISQPIIHHRTEAFKNIIHTVIEDLKYVFQTKHDVVLFSASGTGSMEASVVNFLSKKDKALVVNAGKFGARWKALLDVYGIQNTEIKVESGNAVKPNQIKEILSKDNYKALFMQACETSTGVYHPIEEIANILKDYPQTLFIIDAISSLGACDLPMDMYGIDVVCGASQKALMLPPGLAFLALNHKAKNYLASSDLPKYYFDIKKELKNLVNNQTSYTPAISLIFGLKKSLELIKNEGLKNIFTRIDRFAHAMREGIKALGLSLFANAPSNSVTAIKIPEKISGEEFIKTIEKKYQIKFAGGQEELKGKIFRITHMGYINEQDILGAIQATGLTLKSFGFECDINKALKVANDILFNL